MPFFAFLISFWSFWPDVVFEPFRPAPAPEVLYPFRVSDARWGYLNAAGTPVIEARFQAAQPFAEGLAAVREKGRYGYAEASGRLRIAALYDYATPFRQGYALVWQRGQPLVINQQGQLQFTHAYADVQLLTDASGQPPYCLVSTRSRKQGVTDVRGRLLIDTVFRRIEPFQSGVSVVRGLHNGRREAVAGHPGDSTEISETGVINRQGQWVVPFGRYHEIRTFERGYAKAWLPEPPQQESPPQAGWSQNEVLLDSTGQVRCLVPGTVWHFPSDNLEYANGLAVAQVYLVRPDTVKVWSSHNRYDFASLVDTQGRLVFRNEDIDDILPFAEGRSFAQTQDKLWHLLDGRGRFVTPVAYAAVLGSENQGTPGPAFQQGVAFVQTAEGAIQGIDTAGRVTVPSRTFTFDYNTVFRQGDFIVFQEDISQQRGPYTYRYGLWHPASNVLIPPRFHELGELKNFTPGTLLAFMQDGRMGYLNRAGGVIWQQPRQPQRAATSALDIDFMARATYTVASAPLAKYAGFGGWAGSGNHAQPIKNRPFGCNTLSVSVAPKPMPGIFQRQYAGHRLAIANTTPDTVVFEAQDSMLDLLLEAKDELGRWRAIEYVPQSWCGNSYHTVFLAPGHYWQLAVPAYQGARPTRLRARLLVRAAAGGTTADFVYSNEFEGSVNPAQFWRQPGYQPAGLMDPYNN